MPKFSYKAIANTGKTIQGDIVADRIELASRELRSQGLTLLSLEAGSSKPVVGPATSGKRLVSRDLILAMTRELAVLLRAGLPIDRALKVMIEMAAEPVLEALLEEILTAVKGGKGISDALQPHRATFGNFYINMVRSGEASGHMPQVLARLVEYLENSKTVRSSVVSALTYPAILMIVAVLSIIGMLGFVVPQFESLFSDMGDALPVLTRAVIAAGEFVQSYGWLLILLVTGIVVIVRRWLQTDEGRLQLDQRLLKLPVMGNIIFKYEVAKFARTVGTLLGNGVSLLQSISIASDTVDNTEVRQALSVLEPAVKRGKKMSIALDETKTFTPMVIQMIRVGEESGSLDQMMIELAQVYDEEVQAGVKRGLTLLEPVIILVMGGAISIVIIAVLLGIMSVNDLAL